MNSVSTNDIKVEDYAGIVPEQLLAEISQAAGSLKGLRVVHVNAPINNGDVTGILKSLTPLMCDVGIDARWYTLAPDESFNCVCKRLRRSLQGDNCCTLSPTDIDLYLANNERAASTLLAMGVTADIWLFHDFQVLPMLSYMKPCNGLWIWHDGVTRLNAGVRELLLHHMMDYRAIAAGLPEHFMNNYNPCETVVIPPAIDPLQPGHNILSTDRAREIMSGLGIDPTRPVICQVSHFDDFNNLRDTIDACRLAGKNIHGLQLVLAGTLTAREEPDSHEVITCLQRYIKDDSNIYVFTDPAVVGEKEINALQCGADIIIQQSAGEGFNLRVTEAMWKGRPVIGSDCDGIRFQIRDGLTGFLANDVRTCAKRIAALLMDPALAAMIGSAARESVRKKYLVPRLLRDYLQVFSRMVEGRDMVIRQPGHTVPFSS